MGQRALAIIGAIGLVALALVARQQLAEGGTDGDRPSRGGAEADAELPVVACTPDLEEICQALAGDAKIAPAAEPLSLTQAADPPANIDGWITWDPAPQLVDLDSDDPRLWEQPTAVAHARLAVLAAPSASSALAGACASSITWMCVAETADLNLPTGSGSPDSAEGLARLAPLAPSLHAAGDPTDVRVDVLNQILDGPVGGQSDAATMVDRIITQPGSVSLVTGPLPALRRAADSEQGKARRLQVSEPQPPASIVVDLVGRAGRTAPELSAAMDTPTVAATLEALGLSPGPAELATEDRIGELFQIRERG